MIVAGNTAPIGQQKSWQSFHSSNDCSRKIYPLAPPNPAPCRCSPYILCCCAPADGRERVSRKVESTHHSTWGENASSPPPASPPCQDAFQKEDCVALLNGFTSIDPGTSLKSNLKLPRQRRYTPPVCFDDDADSKMEDASAASDHKLHERKSIQWQDSLGKELIEVREYEASDSEGSDDDPDDMSSCICAIQ